MPSTALIASCPAALPVVFFHASPRTSSVPARDAAPSINMPPRIRGMPACLHAVLSPPSSRRLHLSPACLIPLPPGCRPYWRCYYPNTQAVIYVVDSTDVERMSTSKEEFHTILQVSA